MALWARLRSFWHNVLHRSDLGRAVDPQLHAGAFFRDHLGRLISE